MSIEPRPHGFYWARKGKQWYIVHYEGERKPKFPDREPSIPALARDRTDRDTYFTRVELNGIDEWGDRIPEPDPGPA